MGPRGGSEQKPVGMVWVAASSAEKTVTQVFQFRFDRSRNIELTAINALNVLRQLILGKL
jgi:nicotinamide-nucleotide amidase